MNKYHILSLVCFIPGFTFFAVGFLTGEAEGGVFIIFPFISGSGIYTFLGFIFIFIAILLFMFGFVTHVGPNGYQSDYDDYKPRKKTSVKGGGVVLIGPIPIVFGSNWKIVIVLMIVAIILIFVTFFTFRVL